VKNTVVKILYSFTASVRPVFIFLLLRHFGKSKIYYLNLVAKKLISLFDPNNIRRRTHKKIKHGNCLFEDADGVIFELNLNEHIDFNMFIFGYFDNTIKCLIKQYLNNQTIFFIDVGANIGSISIPVSSMGVQSVAIEPSKNNYDKLLRNIERNQSNLLTKKIALVSELTKGKEIALFSPPGNYGSSSFSPEWNPGLTENLVEFVETCTLDALVEEIGSKLVDKLLIIKIDVEGMEFEVLEGSRETLLNYRPLLVLEWRIDKFEKEKGYQLINKIISLDNYKIYALTKYLGKIVLRNFNEKSVYENILVIPTEKISLLNLGEQ
jgi:FkbM family methyltransferase